MRTSQWELLTEKAIGGIETFMNFAREDFSCRNSIYFTYIINFYLTSIDVENFHNENLKNFPLWNREVFVMTMSLHWELRSEKVIDGIETSMNFTRDIFHAKTLHVLHKTFNVTTYQVDIINRIIKIISYRR